MDKQAKNFIRLISSYVNDNINNINSVDDIEWNVIVEYAKIHNLGGVVYLIISSNKMPIDTKIMSEFSSMFFCSVKYSTLQEYALNNILLLFNNNKIAHILFKGSVLKYYYPNHELRTMGDIDIVIKREQQNEVHNLLIENGYKFDEFESKQAVRNYTYKGILFEIHTEIIHENFIPNVDLVEYFEDNFGHSVLKDRYTYEFNQEHHLIYLIVHLAKHFSYSGCGVRMFVDLAVFIKQFTDLDWDYIEEQLKNLKLYDFTYNILVLCNRWFDTKIYLKGKIVSEEKLDYIADYIIQGGVFGYNNKNMDSIIVSKGKDKTMGILLNIIKLIFPSYEYLLNRYVWCGKIPKILLPVAWIKYWIIRLKSNKNDFKRICNALRNEDDVIKHNKIMKAVGLNIR